jgi:hypothetical protein
VDNRPLAITPPIAWRMPREQWPRPPEGYRTLVVRATESKRLKARYGVPCSHIGFCTYVLWVREDGDAQN